MDLGEPIAKGNTAQIYLADNKIIKLFNDNLPESEAAYEASKQVYARTCRLPVPAVYEVTRINGKQAIVMEYIRGDTLGNVMYRDMANAENYLQLSVELQLKIHALPADGLVPMPVKLNRQILRAAGLDERSRSALLDKLGTLIFEPRLCHGDYHVFNLIQTDSELYIIDWVDASSGDRRADVCRTYLLYMQHSPELAELYLQLYCKQSGLTRDEILSWMPVIAGARLSEGVSATHAEQLSEIVNKYRSI